MHATHNGPPLRAAWTAILAFALFLAAGPARSQTTPEPPSVPTVSPTPGAAPAVTPAPPATTPGIAFDSSSPTRSELKLDGPRSASLDLSRSVPFIGRRSNTRVLSGYYIFSDRNRGNLSGIHPGSELPLILRTQLEENYSRRGDIHRRTSIVGLWASIPIFENSLNRRSQGSLEDPAEPPNRTLVAAIGTDTTRHRTSRKGEIEAPGQGFFSRLRPHTGILERSKSEEATPLKPEPTPESQSAPASLAAPEKAKEDHGPLDFLRRLWH